MIRNSVTLKRIYRDFKEIKSEPLEGIGIEKISNTDDYNYVVNIKIIQGIYKGILIQLKMILPLSYPIYPPEMLIYPDQVFGPEFHHHIFLSKDNYKKFCVDILNNAMMSTTDEKTGWCPSYTFRTLLMQIQIFLSQPDINPNSKLIEKMIEENKKYIREFTNEEGETITHSYELPYPSISENIDKKRDNIIEINGDNSQFEMLFYENRFSC